MQQVRGLHNMIVAMRAASMVFRASGDLLHAMVRGDGGGPLYAATVHLASDDMFVSAIYQKTWREMSSEERIDTLYDHIRGVGMPSLGDDFIDFSESLKNDILNVEITDPDSPDDVRRTEEILENMASSSDSGYMKILDNATRIYGAIDRARDIFTENGGEMS